MNAFNPKLDPNLSTLQLLVKGLARSLKVKPDFITITSVEPVEQAKCVIVLEIACWEPRRVLLASESLAHTEVGGWPIASVVSVSWRAFGVHEQQRKFHDSWQSNPHVWTYYDL